MTGVSVSLSNPCKFIVKRKMGDSRTNNADKLKAAIKATRSSITSCYVTAEPQADRLHGAVIHAKGAASEYGINFRSLSAEYGVRLQQLAGPHEVGKC
ncbi:hypothetical protein ATANTOWER_012375 [Ataeniobius toweri]|uniref:Uncharacterized protein n=1 Tax=Ataeniobius toweri TaxID=208326 RepID=A0ABU7BP86_9TELE|nr:hypothetical protein [Ataeniobius toweri]